MKVFRRRLQQWDVQSNRQIHDFIANSHHVAERVNRHYGCRATVVHPLSIVSAFLLLQRTKAFI